MMLAGTHLMHMEVLHTPVTGAMTTGVGTRMSGTGADNGIVNAKDPETGSHEVGLTAEMADSPNAMLLLVAHHLLGKHAKNGSAGCRTAVSQMHHHRLALLPPQGHLRVVL